MEHIKTKPPADTVVFFRAIAASAFAALVVLGVGGTAYLLLAPDGWLAGVFGRNIAGGIAAVFGLAMVGACLWLTRGFISPGTRERYSELFVYGIAGAGVLYAVDMLAKGNF